MPLRLSKIQMAVFALALATLGAAISLFSGPETPADAYEVVRIPTLPDAGEAQAIINVEKPEVSLSRWNGEAEIKVSYKGVEAPATKDASGAYTWASSAASVQAFAIEASPEIVDGGFEFQVVLNEKPPNNVFDFSIVSSSEMDFAYQAPLDEELAEGRGSPKAVSCTATECFDAAGDVVTSRPENVVGSYAVYAKGFRDHVAGGLNYGTGKMFHIYRPKAIDADGDWVWGTLDYNDGIISVTVPQDFLDGATYPVAIDPTYGYTSLGASEDATDDCILYYAAGAFTGSTGATLSSAHWYGRRSSGSGNSTVWVALYATDGIGPTTRLDSVNGSLALTTTKTQYTISGGTYSGLTNGTSYWLAASSNKGAGWRNEFDSVGSTNFRFTCGFTSAPPDPANDGNSGSAAQFSFYFDYTNPVSAPTVTTQAPTAILSTSATFNGTLVSTGGGSVDDEGFVYDTVSRGDPGNVTAALSGYANFASTTGSFSVGTFSKSVSITTRALFIRAFAHNESGYSYGNEIRLRSGLSKPPNNLGLVGYWSFNEGTSTVTTDFSGNGNTGALTGFSNPPTASSGWANGKQGKALNFDGSNDIVIVGQNIALTGAMTACAWVNPRSITSVNENYIVARDNASDTLKQYALYALEGGKFGFHWVNGAFIGADTTSSVLSLNTWQHICGTRVSATEVHLYLNGVEQAGTFFGSGAVPSVTANTVIGRPGDFSSCADCYWDGRIDEVRLYNRALSASEVRALYGSGAVKTGASSIELQRGSTLGDGLVGHWTFDGSDVTDKIYDRSGSNNNGYILGSATSSAKTIGKLGQAFYFDGADDYVSIGNAGSGIKSVAFWIKADVSASKKIINIDGTRQIETNGNSQVTATSFPAATVYVDGSTASAAIDTGWRHVVITDTSGVSATTFEIGRVSSSYFAGTLDDVRLYNRALSASEIKQLYNLGQAVIRP